jgi:nucleoid DNA-binding protein
MWPEWKLALIVVKAETVIRRHRHRFKWYWRWKSRPSKVGRSRISKEIGDLISELAKGNHLEFRDFSVSEPRECAPRRAQNPRTIEQGHIPAKRIVKFKAGRLTK